LKPFDKGGWGAVQLNGRIDYVNLKDSVGGTPVVSGHPSGSSTAYVNGGRQLGYQVSLIWNPMDYVRFMAQYGHVNIKGGPRNALGNDLSDPTNKRKFGFDTFAMRAQLEF
jgi:phosphate-selective porin OprO/OprP